MNFRSLLAMIAHIANTAQQNHMITQQTTMFQVKEEAYP